MTTLGCILFWGILAVVVIGHTIGDIMDSKGPGYIVFVGILRVIGTLLLEVLILVSLFVLSLSNREPDPTSRQETEIYSMGINSGGRMNGNFVLGCGSVDGKTFPTYRYFTVDGDRYKLNEVNANNFDIVCTDSISPRVVIGATKSKDKIVRLKWLFNTEKEFTYDINPDNYTGTIYIPVGSVIQSYNVQL